MNRSYLLRGTENELLIVIRNEDEDLMISIINRLISSRDDKIKKIGKMLEADLNDK